MGDEVVIGSDQPRRPGDALSARAALPRLPERFGLPRPATNATRSGYELDALYPHARLVVELDGRAVHQTKLAFEER